VSSNLFLYRSNTTATSGYPTNGDILWDNATQISATSINVSHLTDDNIDVDIFLALLQQTETITISHSKATPFDHPARALSMVPLGVHQNGMRHAASSKCFALLSFA
jgi:hypothetical protein